MVIFGLLLFFVILIVVGIAGGLIYLLSLPIKNKFLNNGKLSKDRSRKINTAYIFILVLLSAYLTFNTIFPSKSFYEQEFKTVTLRDIPPSAEFIEKTSSYPDFHGDYCSSSQIKLSQSDYQNLLSELNTDHRFVKTEDAIGSPEFDETLGEKSSKNIVYNFTRPMAGQDDQYLYIGFYEDNQTIFVNICVT